MTQHLTHQHFPAQAFPIYDPATPIYYSAMTPAPEHYAYHQQQQQLDYNHVSGYIHPQHQEQARRFQQLQQDAILRQQQQTMYNQQMLMYQQQQQQQHYQILQPPSPSERMQTKADKRAEHNAVERLRRENLNSKFQQLAHSLPNLQNDRRPSKGTIIERTLDFVKNTMQKEENFLSEIRKLREEYDDLMKQLYPGQSRSISSSILSDDDISSNMGSVSPVSDLGSQKSIPCPSLESPSEASPRLPPTTGLGTDNLFETYAMDINPLNDMLFDHYPEQQPPVVSSYESDDDNSSTSPDDRELTSDTITTSSFPNISTMPGRMTEKHATFPSAGYGLKIESPNSDH